MSPTGYSIRDALPGDVGAITSIYNHAVQHTTSIWNNTIVSTANRLSWLEDRQSSGYPVLVAVKHSDSGSIMGYTTYGQFRPHDGYRHTVEHSIYVHIDHQGRGIGKALLLALIDRAKQGETRKHATIAGIDASNLGSIRLHRKLGFEEAGVLKQVGMKFGRWLDLQFMQLILDDRETPVNPTV